MGAGRKAEDVSGDGKCPDIYECRLGSDKMMRGLANAKLRAEVEKLRAELAEKNAAIEWYHKQGAEFGVLYKDKCEKLKTATDALCGEYSSACSWCQRTMKMQMEALAKLRGEGA